MVRSLKTLSDTELDMIASRVAEEQMRRGKTRWEMQCLEAERTHPGHLCLVVDNVGFTGGMGPWVQAQTAGVGWFKPGDVFCVDGTPWEVVVKEFLTEPAIHGWITKLVAPTWAPVLLRAVSKDAPRLEKLLAHGSVLVQKTTNPAPVLSPGERVSF